jgi:signal transduction histidine kinase
MPINLLFVDDEPKLQAVVRQLFRQEIRENKYNIVFALNGREALHQLRTADTQFDVILTDLNMPEMSGLALLNEIQLLKSALNPALTAVVVSAYGDMENIRRAMNAGAYDFLTKPLDFEDMRITLEKTINHVASLKDAYEQTRLANETLRRLNEELEQRVRQRTLELQTSNAELNAFAHTVAHDLKNPLGIVAGYIDFAVDLFHEIDQTELLETLLEIKQHTYKVISITEELMLLSGVRKLQVSLDPLDMATIIANSQKRLGMLISEYQGRLILPQSWPVAIGHTPWVEQVWVNYLSNGLKYGGPYPELTLGAEPLPDGMIRFWVRDKGLGSDPADQSKLFVEFTRLDEIRVQGYGLGLSIVRRIVERLGGQVGVNSQPGLGSEFYFTLPAA